MLDILRKHASSWIIKFILGAIVVSFVFFFGYNSMRRASKIGRLGNVEAVASVNGEPIAASEYQFVLDQNYERMRASFEGKDIPEFVRKMAEAATLQQLVSRDLAIQQATALGLIVPDEEVADAIRRTPSAQQGGEFDPIYYRHEFLPYFKHRFGVDYELMVRQEIEAGALESIFHNVDANPMAEKSPKGNESSWAFEVITLDPAALVEAKAVKDASEAKSFATTLIAANPKNWKSMLTPFKLNVEKVGPIKLSERTKLFEGQGTFETYKALLSLSDEVPVIKEPVELGNKIYVVRLVSMTKGGDEGAAQWPAGDFYRSWMAKLSEKAKVVNYLKESK